MKVLVTGANGFVGRGLCPHLARHGIDVRMAVRGADSRLPDAVVVGEIGPHTQWGEALADVDVVVHLAARVHVMRDSASHPLEEYRRVNVEGTRRLAQAASEAGVRRMVLLSSVKVNGEAREQAYTETDPPRPKDDYGRSKWEAEQALIDVGAQTGLEWAVLRPPLVYGPGVRANFLSLMRAVSRGLPLPLGAIDNQRSLVYLGNLADAIRVCVVEPGAANGLFLVSDGEDVSTPELVRRVARSLGVRPRLVSVPVSMLRLAGMLVGKRAAVERLVGSLQVDSTCIRRTLGWTPPFSIDEGLTETARWWRTA